MTAYFDLNGINLTVLSESGELLTPLLPYIGAFGCEKSATTDFTMTLERMGEYPPPADADILTEGPLPEGRFSRLATRGDTTWLNVPGGLSLELSLNKRSARISIEPGSENLLGGTVGLVAIEAILTSAGQALVHAAALKLPEDERAFILFARSGAGKTTTALALALQGFGLLTDDATVLVQAPYEDRVRHLIWGLPRALKVHKRTGDLLPCLAPILGEFWNAEGEQVVTQETLRSITDVCPPRPYPLAAVIILGARVAGPHIVRKVEKPEILVSLADDNVRRSHHGVLGDQLVRFERMAAAIAATPTFELRVGTGLASLGKDILAALAPCPTNG